jgi:arylsulfatase A-like enzyme
MAAKPNVIIIMTDQQRADLSQREGYSLDTTPFLDQLAQQGVWFNRAYTPAPICVAARTSMLTGRYPSATHVRSNHNIKDAFYSKDMFDVFRSNGYAIGFSGKNHSYKSKQDADFWFPCDHMGVPDELLVTEEEKAFSKFIKSLHFHVSMEPTPFPLELQGPYRIVSAAQEWISSLDDQPFFLWMSIPEPHNPNQVPEPYYSMFPPETLPPTLADESDLEKKGFPYQWCRQSFEIAFADYQDQIQRARSNYLGMLRLIDDQIKRFVTFLDQVGVKDNTIFIFLSDHGDFVGEYGLLRKGPELSEPLVRVPLQICGPDIMPHQGPHPAHVSLVDIFPTLCEAIGSPLPDGVQGRSLWPLLTGTSYPETEFASAYAEQGFGGLHYTANEPLDPASDGLVAGQGYDCLNSWTQSGTMRMIRKGDWKLQYDMQGRGQLYNLVEDPVELNNLWNDPRYNAIQQELVQDLLTWVLRVHDPLPLPRRRYVLKRDPRNYWEPYRKP